MQNAYYITNLITNLNYFFNEMMVLNCEVKERVGVESLDDVAGSMQNASCKFIIKVITIRIVTI